MKKLNCNDQLTEIKKLMCVITLSIKKANKIISKEM